MKYLYYLLLLCSICNAQDFKNRTKVTAYRLVNSDETGPCSIAYYAKKLKTTGHYIQAMEFYNDTLAYNLLKLKGELHAWKRDTLFCAQASVGQALVPNMFIVEVNALTDTIFTTAGHSAVYIPTERTQYTAPEKYITSFFPTDMNNFFSRDYASEIEAWKMDTIPVESITFRKKQFYGLTRKEFEKQICYFPMATTDSIFSPDGKFFKANKSFYMNEIQFMFGEKDGLISTVTISNKPHKKLGHPFSIDGVTPDDNEDVLCSKYDNTTSLKNWFAPLDALHSFYTYEVYLEDGRGLVRYTMRDATIQSILISFYYPKANAVVAKKKTKTLK